MKKNIFQCINKILNLAPLGISIKLVRKNNYNIPYDIEKKFLILYEKCKKFTLTSLIRMFSLYNATNYVIKNKIPGDIVECGVWKGGSIMLSALTLLKSNDIERKIYLYDTYEGMPEPTNRDVRYYDGLSAREKWKVIKDENKKWFYGPLEEVKKNLYSTGYPKENLIFIEGKVENTIPGTIPKKISILRLDTDWYESTYHELKHLFPILSENGVLILDDYGFWKGAKEATDKYIKENKIKIFLNRIDGTGRVGIKVKN